MKDDYLWDRSGQPDPEIQQLEEILGELRYPPRPLEIPGELKTGANRFNFPRYAIAAALAIVVLGLGIWLTIQRQQPANPANVATGKLEESKPPEVKEKATRDQGSSDTAALSPIDEKKLSGLSASNNQSAAGAREDNGPPLRVRKANRVRRPVASPRMTAEEIAEAEVAKERLMMALRLASSKLNYVQKKTQGAGPATPVYHQHKIG